MSHCLNSQNPNVLHVAVGAIVQSGQVLICWRDASLHQGNRYEFPGGKVEANETPLQALKRELFEEINIEVKQAVRAQQLYFNYPEKSVCLHIFKVTEFTGVPCGQQNQAIRWVSKYDLNQYQFPDANAPILRMVLLPDEYVITQPQGLQQTLNEWMDWHIQYAPQQAWLYLRHQQLHTAQYLHVMATLANQRPDLKLFAMYSHIKVLMSSWPELESTLTGVHINQTELMHLDDSLALPSAWYRIAACHDALSIAKANKAAVDALLLSPLHPTRTHAGQLALGWQQWQQLCETSTVPVYALGGVAPGDLTQVQDFGGFGVAGISAFYRY